MLNLYKISQNYNNGYDTWSDAVVVANTSDEAKLIHPAEYKPLDDGKLWYESDDPYEWSSWALPEHVTVELIGIAAEHLEAGTVICASFHAG